MFRRTSAAATTTLAVVACAVAVVPPQWTVLNNTRCHNDLGQWHNVTTLAACEDICAQTTACYLVTYCPANGASGCATGGSGPHPLTCWGYTFAQLPGCDAEDGWVSGWTAPPPPLPPPSDWLPAIASGNMAWSADSADAIGEGFFPVVGNGFLAIETGPFTQPFANSWPYRSAGSFHLAGVFSGKDWTTPSHRAQISKLHGMSITPLAGGNYSAVGSAIDFASAAFFNRTNVSAPGCTDTVIEQRSYVHRSMRELFVYELRAFSASGSPDWTGCTLPVQWAVNSSGPDTLFSTTAGDANTPAVWFGTTVAPEEPSQPLRSVAVAFDSWLATPGPRVLSFTPSSPLISLRAVLRSDLDVGSGASPATVATAAGATWAGYASLSSSELWSSHTAAWAELWASGGVELAGNSSFASTVNASLYDILSSLRDDWNWSTSPGGLGAGGYAGHSFWDWETWVSPVVTVLFPRIGRAVAQYRIDRVDASLQNAALSGFDGAMWAWESAFSGLWTAPWREADTNEHHISADIPLSLRKFYYATGDREFLSASWRLLNETCRFWECRFTRTDSIGGPPPGYAKNCGPKDGVGNWTIYNVIPPDESTGITNSSAYTNAAAAQTLSWCIEAGVLLGHATPPLWAMMSAAPYLPLNASLFPAVGGAVHVQDAHYTKPRSINQADVALLQYPLGLQFDRELAKRDLDAYASVTDFAGMFTGDSSYACAYLALGNRTAADAQLALAFSHMSPQFHVFTEKAYPDISTQHFITGSGGYIQSFVFGYSGMRIARLGVLTFSSEQPVVPPLGVTAVTLRGVTLLGTKFNFFWNASSICVTLQPGQGLKSSTLVESRQGLTSSTSPHAVAPLELRVQTGGRVLPISVAGVCVDIGPVDVAGVGFP